MKQMEFLLICVKIYTSHISLHYPYWHFHLVLAQKTFQLEMFGLDPCTSLQSLATSWIFTWLWFKMILICITIYIYIVNNTTPVFPCTSWTYFKAKISLVFHVLSSQFPVINSKIHHSEYVDRKVSIRLKNKDFLQNIQSTFLHRTHIPSQLVSYGHTFSLFNVHQLTSCCSKTECLPHLWPLLGLHKTCAG